MRPPGLAPDAAWEELLEELCSGRGASVIIGATDSGKSTLARYLVNGLLKRGHSVSLVDSDVGQSSLGLPGTISMKTFTTPSTARSFRFRRMSFIGTVNPAKMMLLIIETAGKMVRDCREESERVLMDTSGLIDGELGRALQLGKIRAAQARHVIALQRGCELEHILEGFRRARVHRLRVSDSVKVRKREDRAMYRRKKLELYFGRSPLRSHFLKKRSVALSYGGRHVAAEAFSFREGTMMGLNQDDYTKALGILVEITGEGITYWAKTAAGRKINRIVLGDMTADGTEAPPNRLYS